MERAICATNFGLLLETRARVRRILICMNLDRLMAKRGRARQDSRRK